MPLADGQVFAGYTILSTLGAGGMGEVYLAAHPRLPRHDALKVLGAAVSHDAEYRQRFNQEAEMVATLSHPNIVTIYDRGENEGRLWIAMEFVDGIDAYRLMARRHPRGVPADEVVRIVAAVAGALDFAHSRQVLHRDVKPANILLGHPGAGGDPGRVLLADFGVARWVGQPSDLTGTEVTVGTVNYAAPEQLTGQPLDGRADQYALAGTAFHLMTGSAPFSDTNPAVVIGQHLGAAPPRIGSHRPELAAFGPVFAKALAKKPANRYGSCHDFAEAMRRALGQAATGSGRHHRAAPASGWRKWVAPGVAAGVAAALLAAGVALLSAHRGGDTETSPAAPTSPPPPAVAGRMDLPVVVLGAGCGVLGAAAVTEAGQPAYCSNDSPVGPQAVWSPQPERLRSPAPRPSAPP